MPSFKSNYYMLALALIDIAILYFFTVKVGQSHGVQFAMAIVNINGRFSQVFGLALIVSEI